MSFRDWVLLSVIGAAFGMSFALNEVLLGTYGPLTVSATRVALGALGCWVWVLATGRSAKLVVGAPAAVAVLGIFQFAAPFALLPLAQQHITSSAAGIANAMTPVAVVIVSHLWAGGERATPRKLAGVALGVAGIATLATRGAESGGSDPRFLLLAVAAPFCYAVALNLGRQFRGADPVVLVAWAMTGGAVAIMPVALATEGLPALPGAADVAAMAAIGFGLTSVAFLAMYSILPRVGAVNVSLVTFIAPLSATTIGVALMGETVGAAHLAGMALILAGLAAIDGRLLRILVPPRRLQPSA